MDGYSKIYFKCLYVKLLEFLQSQEILQYGIKSDTGSMNQLNIYQTIFKSLLTIFRNLSKSCENKECNIIFGDIQLETIDKTYLMAQWLRQSLTSRILLQDEDRGIWTSNLPYFQNYNPNKIIQNNKIKSFQTNNIKIEQTNLQKIDCHDPHLLQQLKYFSIEQLLNYQKQNQKGQRNQNVQSKKIIYQYKHLNDERFYKRILYQQEKQQNNRQDQKNSQLKVMVKLPKTIVKRSNKISHKN